MSRPGRVHRGCLVGLLAIALLVVLLVAFFPITTIIWDGCFSPCECRLRFVDANGRPVPGVKLQVLTKAGGVCHFYPVDEFLPDSTPTSDAEGWMVFHHVGGGGVEYSGRDYESVVGIPLRTDDAPQYDCVFLLDGREVHRVPFNTLSFGDEQERRPTVTRTWTFPAWDSRKYWSGDEDMAAHRLRMCDGNHDGKLDREEAVAATQYLRRFELPSRTEEITFPVVERTIVVPDR